MASTMIKHSINDQQKDEELNPVLLTDYTDLLSFFRRGLPITGIQRVVFEISQALYLSQNSYSQVPVSITPFRRNFGPVKAELLDLIEIYGKRNDVANRSLRTRTLEALSYVKLLNSRFTPSAMKTLPPSGNWLLMLGASWSRQNFEGILHATTASKLQYKKAVLVHDLLPIERPDLTRSAVASPFKRWIDLVLLEADVIFTPSEATTKALLQYQGADCGRIKKLRFGVTSFSDHVSPLQYNDDQPFILYVSSVHPRKNHRLAISAWAAAFASDHASAPKLVFVGHSTRKARFLLKESIPSQLLREKIVFLNDIDDYNLKKLYKDCLFFIFPSKYEGWGLPVNEALSLGKFGIVSDVNSLPEVGEGFVDYISPYNTLKWAKFISFYFRNPEMLRARELNIIENFKPGLWITTAQQILDSLRMADRG